MKRILIVAFGALAVAACSDTSPVAPAPLRAPATPVAQIVDGDVVVSSSDDAGPGSLRDAIAQANANAAIRTIAFQPDVNTIDLASGIVYTGSQGLTINGNHATIDGANAGGTAFRTTSGADLTLAGLTFRNAPGEGVRVDVPAGATGTIHITLLDVDIVNNLGTACW